MTFFDFVTLVLASWAVTRAWFRGDLFARARAKLEAAAEGDSPSACRLFCRLLTCPFCLSYYPAALLALAFFVPAVILPAPWDGLCRIPVYVLAAAPLVYGLYRLEHGDVPPPDVLLSRVSRNSPGPGEGEFDDDDRDAWPYPPGPGV